MTRIPTIFAALALGLFVAPHALASAPEPESSEPRDAAAAPIQSPHFSFANEEFYYSIRVNGVEALKVAVRSGDIRYKKDIPYVPISGTAHSTGFFHTVYPVRDRANTFLNPTDFRPIRSEKYFEEAGEVREYKVDFVHPRYSARVEKRKNARKNAFTRAVPDTTHDMITWFYELRARESIEVGDELVYFIYDGWKLSRITGKVAKREDIYTPMGWFKAHRIDFQRDVMRSRRQKGGEPELKVRNRDAAQASLWVSRDANRLPVKFKVKTGWGSGEALLIKFKIPGLP